MKQKAPGPWLRCGGRTVKYQQSSTGPSSTIWPCLFPQFSFKFHYTKRRFFVTLKCRQMHGVINVDEIKN
jgi:hypothetical protein